MKPTSSFQSRFWLATSLILAGALLRLLPHPWNFTPIGAIALFAGATLRSRIMAFAVPLLSLLLSDALLEVISGSGFHSGMPVVYASFALSVWIGWWVRRRRNSPTAVAAAAVSSATLFYLTTNFWVWAAGHLYPTTVAGLVTSYVAAIPFYGNNLAADLLYSALLFGTFVWAERRFPMFAESQAAA